MQAAEDVDIVIRADILDLVAEPLLHDIVTRNILHGPYGNYNPSAPCMRNSRYRFRFPQDF